MLKRFLSALALVLLAVALTLMGLIIVHNVPWYAFVQSTVALICFAGVIALALVGLDVDKALR